MPARLLYLLLPMLLALPAEAHTGQLAPHSHSFLAGLMHPLTGADHMAAMIAVGVWAALAGGRRAWTWPAAFVGAMAIGGLAGWMGFALPFVEQGIAASLLVLGLLIALAVTAPEWIGAGLLALFALFHGHAHGAEAAGVPFVGYAAGFVIATASLHAAGIGMGIGLRHVADGFAVRAAGAATAALGVALLIG